MGTRWNSSTDCRRPRAARTAAWLVGAALVLRLSAAAAQPAVTASSPEDRAGAAAFRIHYERAKELFQAQDYAAAIPELQAAFSIRAVPRLLYNLGQSFRKLDKEREAVAYFELYLRTDSEIPPLIRADVERYLAELRARAESREKQRIVEVEKERIVEKERVVEKTRLVYVPQSPGPPKWQRPLGGALMGAGAASLAAGIALLAIDGGCTGEPVAPALVCPEIYVSKTPGAILTAAGGGVVVLGAVLFGLSFRRPPAARPRPSAPSVFSE